MGEKLPDDDGPDTPVLTDIRPTLVWMVPTDPQATLSRAADKLGISDTEIVEPPGVIPPVHNDFWGSVVILYEAGRIVSIEKRELW